MAALSMYEQAILRSRGRWTMTECDKPMTLDEIIEALQHYRDSDEIVFGLSDDCIEGLRLATAALAERDKEIERFRAACTAMAKGNMERDAEIERLRKLVPRNPDTGCDCLAANRKCICSAIDQEPAGRG